MAFARWDIAFVRWNMALPGGILHLEMEYCLCEMEWGLVRWHMALRDGILLFEIGLD